MKLLSLDTETSGKDFRHGAKPFLVTICDEDYNNTYWQWRVDPKTRQPIVIYNDLIEIQEAIDAADYLVLQNTVFDITALQTVFLGRLKFDWSKIYDTLFAGHVLASNQPHGLTPMALIYLGVNLKPYEDDIEKLTKAARTRVRNDKTGIFDGWRIAKKDEPDMPSAGETVWKYDMWLPTEVAHTTRNTPNPFRIGTEIEDYANSDSATTMALFKRQREELKRRKLWDIYVEKLKLLRLVYMMQEYGVTLNGNRLDELYDQYTEESETAGNICTNIAQGMGYDLVLPKGGNNKSLTEFVFDVMKLDPVEKSKKTGAPSLKTSVLDVYDSTLPAKSKKRLFVRSLRNKRKRDTARTYMEGYKRFWKSLMTDDQEDNAVRTVYAKQDWYHWYKLHPSLNPTGTDTLRWSSSAPNEQNISKKEGFNLRYAFGPAPGREWWSLDYDNLELRIPAYESGEQVMIDIFEKPDEPPYWGSYHLLNASIVYPDLFWSLAEDKGAFRKKYSSTYYQWIKNFGFAVSYGAVVESGTADRAAHKPGAQQMVMDRLTEHTKLNQKMIDHANKHGYVETIPDKEIDPDRGYPLMCSRSKWGKVKPTIPLNYHVQGTACWIVMRAMIKVQDYLDTLGDDYRMIMNVHDELVFDFPKGNNLPKIRRIQKIMESVGDCVGIPLTCGVDKNPNNWSEGVAM